LSPEIQFSDFIKDLENTKIQGFKFDDLKESMRRAFHQRVNFVALIAVYSLALGLVPRPQFFHSLVGALVGFTWYLITSAPSTGKPNRIEQILGFSISLKCRLCRDWHLHLHHWLYLQLILVCLLYVDAVYMRLHYIDSSELMTRDESLVEMLAIAIGFCLGGSVQGFAYDDWSKVIYTEVGLGIKPK
jgi:hypothetical protein